MMALEYKSIVPWGRSYKEYIEMFDLSEEDLNKRILGCGDGPAGFNSIMNKNNKYAVSVDPVYNFTAEEIKKRIDETSPEVIEQTRNNMEKFIWKRFRNVDDLVSIRMDAMQIFLEDFEKGKQEKRYISAELPNLPFNKDEFDLCLVSHFLFLYTDHLSYEFHLESIQEILRVSKEIRLFPLLDFNAVRSPYVDRIENYFTENGYTVSEIQVTYEFQINGNKMLRIARE